MDLGQLVKDALLSQTKKDAECILWMGFFSIDRIPRAFIINRWFDVRVLSYQLFIGEIPVGQKPKNTCGNWGCINPQHLSLVVERETKTTKPVAKVRPRTEAVRSENGTKKGVSNKLTPAERQEIIDTFFNTPEEDRAGLQSRLAHKYEVTPAFVSQLLKAYRERENPTVAVMVEEAEDAE